MPHYEQDTGLVLGRTPAMVMYLLMKAKHRYALEQREGLAEELRVVKAELKKEKEEKERALDLVLSGMFGWVPSFSSCSGFFEVADQALFQATGGDGSRTCTAAARHGREFSGIACGEWA